MDSDTAARTGALLRRARLAQQMSQQQLAGRLETTQSVISRLESGRSVPTVTFLSRVATALHLTLMIAFASTDSDDLQATLRDDPRLVIDIWPRGPRNPYESGPDC